MRAWARLRTEWGEFVGPETTPAESAAILGLGAAGGVLAPALSRCENPAAARAVLRIGAADLWGGALANNTRGCARWYERPGQTDADHLRFAACHLHPAAVALLDRGRPRRVPGWVWAGAHYGYLIGATVLIRRAPRHRRALGAVLTAGGVALDVGLGPSASAPWFAPVFYTKLLLGHAAAALWPDAALHGP